MFAYVAGDVLFLWLNLGTDGPPVSSLKSGSRSPLASRHGE